MFTGIITDLGMVQAKDGGRFAISTRYAPETIEIGASIACDGCCLTAVKVEPSASGGYASVFHVDVSNETLSKTTLGKWRAGRNVNLERALGLGAELGGHLVTGHVDGVATITAISEDGNSHRFRFEMPRSLAGYVAAKGSIALDGTSLTVNGVGQTNFDVAIIPHTRQVTTWGGRKVGDAVNLEVDLLARYVARLNEARSWS